jgi:phosphate transport system substrate-binding protein
LHPQAPQTVIYGGSDMDSSPRRAALHAARIAPHQAPRQASRHGLHRLALLSAVALAALGGCGRHEGAATGAAATSPQRVMVVGSSTVAPLMGEIAKAYEQAHPGVRIEVQAGGSSRGVLDVRNGAAQLGMVSRELKADEQDLGRALIARDGIGMIVHQSNPIARLTKAQVVAIYTGQVRNWRQLGGADLPITVVSKAEGRSTLDIFSQYVGVPYRNIQASVVIGDNQQGIQTVAGSAASIGYVSIGSAEYEARHGAAIRLVPLDEQDPTSAAVASGEYAISRELNLVYKPPLSAPLQAFVQFAQSQQAAELVRQQYFVPVAH